MGENHQGDPPHPIKGLEVFQPEHAADILGEEFFRVPPEGSDADIPIGPVLNFLSIAGLNSPVVMPVKP